MQLSMRWAQRSRDGFGDRPGHALFGIQQGGLEYDLRAESAEILKFDGSWETKRYSRCSQERGRYDGLCASLTIGKNRASFHSSRRRKYKKCETPK